MSTDTPADLDALNTAHALADQLVFEAGPGGWPCALIRNAHARARVSLYGAQLLSFQPHGQADLLFLSERALYQPGKAIRGGVPVCWPWFGPDPQGLGRPAHGFVRTRPWAVLGTGTTPDGETALRLGLRDTPETLALWPQAFALSLTLTVGRRLRLALHTRNTGQTTLTLTQALHSYLAVGDIDAVRLSGLAGCAYTDKARGAPGGRPVQAGAVSFSGEVDRVYHDAPAALCLEDGGLARRIALRSEGSRSAVVWNPGAALAAGMADLAEGAYRRFVCVETANAGDDLIELAPGGEHRLQAEIGLLD